MSEIDGEGDKKLSAKAVCLSDDFLDSLTDDLVFTLAAFLDPQDLLALGLSRKRFGARLAETDVSPDVKKRKMRREREWSIVEEAARRRAEPSQNDDKWSSCSQLLKRKDNESWLAVDNRLHQLSSVAFHRIIGEGVQYINSNANHVKLQSTHQLRGSRWVACDHVMTEGKHYVEFTATEAATGEGRSQGTVYLGVIRPVKTWDAYDNFRGFTAIRSSNHTRVYDNYCADQKEQNPKAFEGDRHKFFFNPRWERGDVVGILMDLDEGTMTAYLNGRSLGVKVNKLRGHWCWAIQLSGDRNASPPAVRVVDRTSKLPEIAQESREAKLEKLNYHLAQAEKLKKELNKDGKA